MISLRFIAIAILLCASSSSAQDRGGEYGDRPYFQFDILGDSRKFLSPTVGGSINLPTFELLGAPVRLNAYGYVDLFGDPDKKWGHINGSFTEMNVNLETWHGVKIHAETDILTGPFFSTIVGRFGIGRKFKLFDGSLRINVSPLTVGHDLGKYQVNTFWYFPFPDFVPLHERLSFSGFFDLNLDPRRIVVAPHVAFRMFGDFYFIAELRRNEFAKDKNAFALGFSFRPLNS